MNMPYDFDDLGNVPAPWFQAGYPGECSITGHEFEEGDTIRADGDAGWECQECVENSDDEGGPANGLGLNDPGVY
jgi:hypothetical protein